MRANCCREESSGDVDRASRCLLLVIATVRDWLCSEGAGFGFWERVQDKTQDQCDDGVRYDSKSRRMMNGEW